MGIRGLNLMEEFVWSSKQDDGEEGNPDNPKTLFTFGAIDAIIRTMIFDNIMVFSQTADGQPANTFRSGLRNVELVRHMMRKVENYSDPAGKPIPLEVVEIYIHGKPYKVLSDNFISTLPPSILGEMGQMLTEKLSATGALGQIAKNSETP